MSSGRLVEIRDAAISTSPPFPPPTEGRAALNIGSRPRRSPETTVAISCTSWTRE